MRAIAVVGAVLLAASCLAGAGNPKQGLRDQESARLEGSWMMTSFEFNGEKEPEETFRETHPTLQVRGTKMKFRLQDKTLWEGDFTIDPGKAPKTLDVTITAGEHKGERLLAIYELDGDHLKIASARLAAKRPSKFQSEPDGTVVSGYNREKQ